VEILPVQTRFSRSEFLKASGVACLALPLLGSRAAFGAGFPIASPFRLAVINDEISQDLGACAKSSPGIWNVVDRASWNVE